MKVLNQLLTILWLVALLIPIKCFASFSDATLIEIAGECSDCYCECIEEPPLRIIRKIKKGTGRHQVASPASVSDSLNNTLCPGGKVDSDAVTSYLQSNCPELVSYVRRHNILVYYYSSLSEGADYCGYSSCERTLVGDMQRVVKLRVCDVGNNGCSSSHGVICNPCDILQHEITHHYTIYCSRKTNGPCDVLAREVLIQNDAYTKCKNKRSGRGPAYDPDCTNAKNALDCYCAAYHSKNCSSSNDVPVRDKDSVAKICPTATPTPATTPVGSPTQTPNG